MTVAYFPIIIVGGGPIGLACALEAQDAGLEYLILEKGCLVNSLYNYPANMTFFSTSERLEIGNVPFVSNNAKPTRAEALEYYRRVAVSGKVEIHLFEEVLEIKIVMEEDLQKIQQSTDRDARPGTGRTNPLFRVVSNKATYITSNIVIATGFYGIPFLLNVPGENLPKVTHYYKEPHFYACQKVIVVGAMNSAVDVALETWRKGADVTMIVREDQIGERVKYWVRPDIVNRIKEGSIMAFFNSTVKAIRETEVEIETPGGKVTLENDWVIAMTGYQPDLEFLSKTGIRLSNDQVRAPELDPDTHETNVKNVFLAGVICGGMNTHRLFIENSREHAEKIIRTIKERSGNNS